MPPSSFSRAASCCACAIAALILHSTWPLAKRSGKIMLQSAPSEFRLVLDRLMREAAVLDGVLECHHEHFWTHAPGIYVGSLRVLLHSLVKSLPSLMSVGSLMLLLLFIYAVLGVQLFYSVRFNEMLNEDANFTNLGKALITLFRCATGESWNGIMHDLQVRPQGCDWLCELTGAAPRPALCSDDDSDCGRLARDVLQNNETHPESSHGEHVGMGGCFYVGGMTKMLTHKRIHLVETSTCDADIARIPARLGLTSPFKVMGEAHVGPFPHHSDAPSDEGMQRLRRHLAHEYALYYELKRLATSQTSSEEGA